MIEHNDNNDAERLIIEHRQSSNFISDFASGAIVTGPTLDKLYFITFYCEAVTVKDETAKIIKRSAGIEGSDEKLYALSMDDLKIENFREDKARIVVTRETLLSLKELLNQFEI